MPLELRDAIKEISPKKLFPIHTEDPGLFSRFCHSLKPKIIIPSTGEKCEL